MKGPQLVKVSNDGNMYVLPFLTLVSGSLAAMAIMKTQYKENLESGAGIPSQWCDHYRHGYVLPSGGCIPRNLFKIY